MKLVRAYRDGIESLDAHLVGGFVVLRSLAAALVLGPRGRPLRRCAPPRLGRGRRHGGDLGCPVRDRIAGAPSWVVTEVGRPLPLLTLSVGILSSPGVARSPRD